MNSTQRNYTKVTYAIMGRNNGHDMWFCTRGKPGFVPCMWSRGSDWAVVVYVKSLINSYLKKALDCADQYKISKVRIVKIITKVHEEETIVDA